MEPTDPNAADQAQPIQDAPRVDSVPIALSLPKGLVSENAFRWPADPMARGGMAQIFAGEDRRLGRTVILKAPREGEDISDEMGQMFVQRVIAEARILAKLQHPSIVTIYELGKSTVGWPFCVMERVDGVSLRDKLDEIADAEKDGKPRTRERLELLSNLVAIAEALAYAHERRVVHRDCTPNNILLGKRGDATLIDWGIARDMDAPSGTEARLDDDDPSASGRMVTISAGTPPYLPLEQSQGRAADPSFDVYSFGVSLYEVVSGKTPFQWRYVSDVKERNQQLRSFLGWLEAGEPIEPASARDPELSGIIARAMAHDARDRFTSDELVLALKQYLTGDLVFSHRYSLTGRLSRWARRNKALTVGIVSLTAFAVAGVLAYGYLSKQAREEAELREMAATAKADASEKARAADEATRLADEANARADQAQKEGKNADALRAEADQKRKTAEALRKSATSAAETAKEQADEANRRSAEAQRAKDEADRQRDGASAERDTARALQADAERQRDAARTAQANAERDRDASRQAQADAERLRDAARSSQQAAESERDNARNGQMRAEQDRDSARSAQTAAERERDSAAQSRTAAERERDEARARVRELEAQLRNQGGATPPADDEPDRPRRRQRQNDDTPPN